MKGHAHRFLKTWLLSCCTFAVGVLIFNVTMDPYLLIGAPRIPGFNARKPAVHHERMIKAYDVLRAQPNAIILGSSRVALGLDATHPAWPVHDRPIYNLGLLGGSPYMARRYLQHVSSQRHIRLVVLTLDFEYFLTGAEPDRPSDPGFEARLSVNSDGTVNRTHSWQQFRDFLHATLSLDAITDSAATLLGNTRPESSDIVFGNVDADRGRVTAAIGSYVLFIRNNQYALRQYSGRQVYKGAMAEVDAILQLCRAERTDVVVVINPMHADMLEMLDGLGYWGAIENWKRELVMLAERHTNADGRATIPVWDFSGYDSYSTEAVPRGLHALQFFWESFHYTRALGAVIVTRIFEATDGDFGVLLTSNNLESHLARIREQQRSYRQRQPADVERVHWLLDRVVRSNPARAPTL